MKAQFLLIALGILLSACSTTRSVQFDSTDHLRRMNREAGRRAAYVTLVDGTEIRVRGFSAGPDFASGQVVGGEYSQWPTSTIRRVQFKHGGKGALQGMLIGSLAGVVIGGLVSAGMDEDSVPDVACPSPCGLGEAMGAGIVNSMAEEAARLAVFLAWTSAGGTLGLLGGAVAGAPTNYRVDRQEVAAKVLTDSTTASQSRAGLRAALLFALPANLDYPSRSSPR